MYRHVALTSHRIDQCQLKQWDELDEEHTLATAIPSPFNPHRYAYDPTNLCYLMPDDNFPGFSKPSWYVKTPGSSFCMHVEQLFAPFYNLCYRGSTTWWVVRREDSEKLNEYIVMRARKWYDVPTDERLLDEERKAIAGLLYTKHVVFHPDELVAAGIRVTELTQEKGRIVIGAGDVVHFGMATVPPGYLRQTGVTGRSVNEAVNFMPIDWLTSGLPLLVDWMQWLKYAWLPMQRDGSDDSGMMTGDGKKHLRAAIRDWHTNSLVAQHCASVTECAAHW